MDLTPVKNRQDVTPPPPPAWRVGIVRGFGPEAVARPDYQVKVAEVGEAGRRFSPLVWACFAKCVYPCVVRGVQSGRPFLRP